MARVWRKRQHILVVEDLKERQAVFRKYYPDCLLAETYEEALAALQRPARYDLVYLDHDIIGTRSGTDVAHWMATRMTRDQRPHLVVVHSWSQRGALAIFYTLRRAGFHVIPIPYPPPKKSPQAT